MNWLLDATPSPALLVLPPAAASLDEAEAAIELWEYYSGKTADPTQRLVVQTEKLVPQPQAPPTNTSPMFPPKLPSPEPGAQVGIETGKPAVAGVQP